MRVVFAATNQTGGFRLRSSWPARALKDRGWNISVSSGWPMGIEAGDVVIIHRPLAPTILDYVRAYREAGVKVLVDEDDDISCIPPSNRWQATAEQLEVHDQAVAEADGVIVTTNRLMKVYGSRARRAYLIRNYLPEWVQGRAMPKPNSDGAVRVGWAGVMDVHRHDMEWLAPFAEAMCRGAMFHTVGDPETVRMLRPGEQVHVVGWQEDGEAFYRAMSWADVGIVPLVPSPFNEAKSWLKALEYMTLGIPVVATKLPEQARLIQHGVTGYLAEDPDDFVVYVQKLVKHPDLRREMGHRALVRARELTLEGRIEEWEAMLHEASEPGPVRRARVRGARTVRADALS